MPKSKIEWTDYTINPVKGKCPMACSYCYARRLYDRFKWNPEIRFENGDIAAKLANFTKPGDKIFWGSTMELFGNWINPEWMQRILDSAHALSHRTHIFLTKQPYNLSEWRFPDNCWVGVSCTNIQQFASACDYFPAVKASVKFISFEPLLSTMLKGLELPFEKMGISWVIIGAETKNGRLVKEHKPKVKWIKEIVEAADKNKTPIFLKDNLIPMIDELPDNCFKNNFGEQVLRQEYPRC